jgi:hypothetical protein
MTKSEENVDEMASEQELTIPIPILHKDGVPATSTSTGRKRYS